MFSLFDYDDTLKTVVHEFKYCGFKRLAFEMGKAFSSRIPAHFFEGFDLVTSVPLYFVRRIRRGYNQADYFAKGIIAGNKCVPVFCKGIIRRKRGTKTQTTLSRKNRRKNVAGAFAIARQKQALVRDKSIILVDDVITTGATTAQCVSVLMEAGLIGTGFGSCLVAITPIYYIKP
jgi:ComF family protein